MRDRGWLRVLFWTLIGVGTVAAGATLLLRDRTERHRRDLFHAHPLRRLAALNYVRSHPRVENALLLRDYLVWEPRPLLRRRAAMILERMQRQIAEGGGPEAAALA